MRPAELYRAMLSHFGEQHWWPVTDEGEHAPSYRPRKALSEKQMLEICAGAILAQNTDWKNAMKALEALNRAKMLDCEKLGAAPKRKIALLVRSSGYYNQKAERLKKFCKYLEKNYSGDLRKFLSKPLQELRPELLSLHGVGNETADDIALYAAGLPSFVVDAYTLRFVGRFFGKKGVGYVEAKAFFESRLPADAAMFGEFHALLVGHGKRYCKKQPACAECFLQAECASRNESL